MREILKTLLEMEKEARDAAFAADDAQSQYATQAEINRRVAQIEREAKARIKIIEHETANEMATRINEIEFEYQQKTATMESFFTRAHNNLVEKIVHEVLHGH